MRLVDMMEKEGIEDAPGLDGQRKGNAGEVHWVSIRVSSII